MGSLAALAIPLLLAILSIPYSTAFKCTSPSNTTCSALIQYISPNATTISAVNSLFGIKNVRSLLGANSLPITTPKTYSFPAKTPINIPFPCLCSDGTGLSNHQPIYTVVSGDFLFHIATDVFVGLVKDNDIAAANNIKNSSLIEIGQKLWIPLPCSCDKVDGDVVVHYGYVVPSGGSLLQIATDYGTTEATLQDINGIADPTKLLAGQVIDVPVKACTSSIGTNSLDSNLLVANGTYALTANGCVQCSCSPTSNYTLQCQPSGLKPLASTWSTCPSTLCTGTNLSLGNTTTSGCNVTTCAYAGYTSSTILATEVATVSSACASRSKSHASRRVNLGGWSSIAVVCLVHLELLYFMLFW